MRRIKSIFIAMLAIFSVIAVYQVEANTVASSTLVFEGPLTYHGGGVYSGTILCVQDFDVYAQVGSIVDSSASSIDGNPVGSDHDAYPNWSPDVPDAYDDGDIYGGGYYALNLSGNSWALWYLQTPGDPNSGPGSYNGDTYDPFYGYVYWANMYAREYGQNWEQNWSWGYENIDLQYPGFTMSIASLGSGQYRVTLTPAPRPMIYSEKPPTYGKSFCPLSKYNIGLAEELSVTVQDLLNQARTLDADISEVEELIARAHELLEKAKAFCENSQNCIAGNVLAIEAQNLLLQAKELLESMLS